MNAITVLCRFLIAGRCTYFVLFPPLSAPCRMNLCTTVTESDVARGKMALKASLVGQLNGTQHVCHSFTQTHTKTPPNHKSHTCLSLRNNTNLRRHRPTHPELRAAYSSGRVGCSDRCELTLFLQLKDKNQLRCLFKTAKSSSLS